jgi:hypothetical protein
MIKRTPSGSAELVLTALTLMLATLVAPASWASGSSASSAASNASSTSVGSLSTSLETSSASSTGGKEVAAGDYRLIEVADSATLPEALRLRLHAVPGSGAAGEFFLHVPRATVERHGVATGRIVSARTRPYGLEFALGTPPRAFFLLVDDDWTRDLRTTVVRL